MSSKRTTGSTTTPRRRRARRRLWPAHPTTEGSRAGAQLPNTRRRMRRAGFAVLFHVTLRFLPGQYEAAVRTYKNPKVPHGVKVREFLGMFGDQDAVVIFEAPDEGTAAELVVQFSEHSQ